jgi:Type I restriction enzyme R protein N terminus (HSDR_N)
MLCLLCFYVFAIIIIIMLEIDFLKYKSFLKVKREKEGVTLIYDPIRRKYLVLQPEELVRQLVLHYLNIEKKYPFKQMRTEKGLIVNELQKRCDILIYDKQIQPYLLVECKAAQIPIDQTVFEQIARYNLVLQVPYLMVTNGLQTYCCQMDYREQSFSFLTSVPNWDF